MTAIPNLVKYFKKLSLKNPLVVSPDQGGKERAKEFAKEFGLEYIALHKKRDKKNGKVQIKTKNADEVIGRDLILVDDMISTGGSIINATQFLKKQKCKRVYVACTHALLMNDAEKKIRKSGVTKIVSANTIPGKTSVVDVSRYNCKGNSIMPESFFVLSKDNLKLATDELIAISKMYDRFSKIKVISNLVIIQSKTSWSEISNRATFVKVSGQILRKMSGLFLDEGNFEILKNAKDICL